MNTLENHTLLYDKDCPMCEVYSSTFIKCGMLEKDGRENFSQMSEKNEILIDYNRAKNEIALINQNSREVSYGLDSLLVIIGNSFPTLEIIGRIKPIYWFFKKFYSFISYNRKVIVPSSELVTEKSCVPSFNLKYRLFYIFFSLAFSTFVFENYLSKMFPLNRSFEIIFFLSVFGIMSQIIFQPIFSKINFYNYIGNLMTVFLIGSFLLIPISFIRLNPIFYCCYFISVSLVMSFDLHRRWKLLRI